MNKIYDWLGGKKWVFTVAAFTVGSVALLLRVNAVILAEWGTFILGLGGFYFAANVKVKRDNQEFQSAMAGRTMQGASSTSTVSVENKGG
jgi:hypothetical protein